jgi:hypothetical protein
MHVPATLAGPVGETPAVSIRSIRLDEVHSLQVLGDSKVLAYQINLRAGDRVFTIP